MRAIACDCRFSPLQAQNVRKQRFLFLFYFPPNLIVKQSISASKFTFNIYLLVVKGNLIWIKLFNLNFPGQFARHSFFNLDYISGWYDFYFIWKKHNGKLIQFCLQSSLFSSSSSSYQYNKQTK
jgi:hypothetical protein